MAELRTLVTGLVVGESPRWHDGRLWYANWGAQEIRTVDDSGSGEVIAVGPKPVGYCIDWLPDGALIVTGEDSLLRRAADGSFTTHADLSAMGEGWNEVTVDGRGNIYVNSDGLPFGHADFRPSTISDTWPEWTRTHAGHI